LTYCWCTCQFVGSETSVFLRGFLLAFRPERIVHSSSERLKVLNCFDAAFEQKRLVLIALKVAFLKCPLSRHSCHLIFKAMICYEGLQQAHNRSMTLLAVCSQGSKQGLTSFCLDCLTQPFSDFECSCSSRDLL
jgi:hypothetical protein